MLNPFGHFETVILDFEVNFLYWVNTVMQHIKQIGFEGEYILWMSYYVRSVWLLKTYMQGTGSGVGLWRRLNTVMRNNKLQNVQIIALYGWGTQFGINLSTLKPVTYFSISIQTTLSFTEKHLNVFKLEIFTNILNLP